MQKHLLVVLIGITSFFSSGEISAFEKKKVDAIVRCMVTESCQVSAQQGLFDNEKGLVFVVVSNNAAEISIILTPKQGLVLNNFIVGGGGKAFAVFDSDLDGIIDRIKVASLEKGVTDDRLSAKMTEVEKELLQDLFDDVLKKVYDAFFAVPNEKKT